MMTCRRYIITGMNKAGKWLLNLFWICIIGGSRILYFLYAGNTAADTYGYFELGAQRAWESGSNTLTGLNDAYIWTLSWLLKLMGNRIEIVGVYQLALQILWMALLFAGISMLLGRKAGFLLSGVLLPLPWILRTVFVISPENYYMLHFSLFLVILGIFVRKRRAAAGVSAARAENEPAESMIRAQNKGAKGKEETKDGQVHQQTEGKPEQEEGYVITKDGRKVKLFDNPLPLPPKHVKKSMGFDFNGLKDDFDYQVEGRDDFDV